jgi:competence protein ComEC
VQKVELLSSKKDWFYFLVFFITLIFINFSFEYKNYQNFISKNIQKVEVNIINQYKKISKSNKDYYVLKCKNSDLSFYTTSWNKDLDNLLYKKVSLKIITKNISFYDYLKGFFAPSFDIKIIYHDNIKKDISNHIKNQHDNIFLQEFFSAIFLATPISKEFRELANIWGISHIIAISGYHLGIIASFLYFIILYPYKLIQQNLFPYNNRRKTILYMTIFILIFYLYFLDFVPSLFRSFIMYSLGVFLFIRHINIFSFNTLLITILIAISIFPKILFSLGFWLSISGVFYIYLYIQYFSYLNKFVSFILFNFFIYMAMMPIVHNFFPIFSYYQLLSPFLTMSFAIFYPIEIILHIFQVGNLLDKYLINLLNIDYELKNVYINFYLFLFYIFISLISIFYKIAFYILLFFMTSFFIYSLYTVF